MTRSYPGYGATQKGFYGRANLSLTDQLTAIVGGRYASYSYDTPYINYNADGSVRASGREYYSESGIFTPMRAWCMTWATSGRPMAA
jgi:outer membrane receptor for ferric coprogen and ferric-rhodotorulic acid